MSYKQAMHWARKHPKGTKQPMIFSTLGAGERRREGWFGGAAYETPGTYAERGHEYHLETARLLRERPETVLVGEFDVRQFFKVVSRQPDNRLISPHPRLATSLAVEYEVGRKTQADIGPIFVYDSLGRPRRDAKRLALVRPGIEIWRCVAGGARKIPRVPPCHVMAKDPALAAAWWRGKAPHVVTRPSFDGAWVANWVVLYSRVDN